MHERTPDGTDRSPGAPPLAPEAFERAVERALARAFPHGSAEERAGVAREVMIELLPLFDPTAATAEGEENATGPATDPPARSPARLARAAHIVAMNHVRRDRARRSARPPHPDGARDREVGRAVRECLRRLLEPVRHPVTLELLGLDAAGIARVLGWPAWRVKLALRQGRRSLARCLARKGVEP